MKRLDCKGLACPKPVILTKKELEAMDSGELEVVVDNETAKENVTKFAKSQGYSFEYTEKDGLYYIIIKKVQPKDAEECPVMDFDVISGDKRPVILIGSNVLGKGDDRLGSALMKSYIYALTESDVMPSTMIFINSGVKLTTEGSEVIDSLKTLESQGVEILSCGTCLDFYGLKEKLLIGSITNMYTIVEKMNNAPNTIKL
ncbi:sulfurtransferase-like selenium metabolism protein YedF [Fonticella tunisiensis]|uniref:Selenium metabolism protein YedF n=1 Tax=Fonticella tunisiensis TaxID=1096341 RepID=A0A4R7K8Z4_9CLOT|nr:sulfurtransferase-like selenium metabolism protein YedF [Fonticella tunisiensis]TDT50477.1 selenium metabolism protein YedF [Fonticella tunisiensis]